MTKKLDLRDLLKSNPKKDDRSDLQKKIDGQITEYTEGSGEGIEEVRAMLSADPENLDLQDWLAFMLYTNNQLDEAIEIYKKLLGQNHKSETQHYYLGNAYCKKGLIQLAIEEWKRVVEIDSESKLAKKAAVRIEQAQAGNI